MTSRLFERDAYLHRCRARVVEVRREGGQARVALDRTVFYPEGGGQPSDRGFLTCRGRSIEVLDVQEGEGGRIWHVVGDDVLAERAVVTCSVDARRRYDHMQQHSAQHVLSRVVHERLGAPTVSFHLGGEGCTIDVEPSPGLTTDWTPWAEAELEANRVAASGGVLRVRVLDVDVARREGFDLEKLPGDVATVRVVHLGKADAQLCCGTHVRATAETLPIKITQVEKIRGGRLRVHFLAGQRALADHHRRIQDGRALSALYSVPPDQVVAAARRQQEEREQTLKALRRARRALMALEAEALSQQALSAGVTTCVYDDYAKEDMAALTAELKELPGGVYLVASRALGSPLHWTAVAPGTKRQVDVGEVLVEALRRFGGRGHGSADFAQGGGVADDDVAGFRRTFERSVAVAAGWAQLPG